MGKRGLAELGSNVRGGDRNSDYRISSPRMFRSKPSRTEPAKDNPGRPSNTNKEVRGAARRKMTSRQRHIKQLRDIQKLQNTTNLLIPKAPFGRLVREISLEINPFIVRYTYAALDGLQIATEAYLIQMLQDAYILTMHRKCVTLSKADIMLIRALKLDL